MSIGVPPMMRIIDCIQIQKYPPPTTRASTPPFENRREEEREREALLPVPWLQRCGEGEGEWSVLRGFPRERVTRPLMTEIAHLNRITPWTMVLGTAATFSNPIRDPHEGYRNTRGHAVASRVCTTGKQTMAGLTRSV